MSVTTTPARTAALATRPNFPAVLTRQVVFGGACWLLMLVFFVGQAVAQIAMKTPYSLVTNEISDLGSTTCGPITVCFCCGPRLG
jgi:hypothetical protein